MAEANVGFIAPASKTYVPAAVLASQTLTDAVKVDYVAARDAAKPPEKRGTWHVREELMMLPGPRKSDPVLRLRRVFVHSCARATAAATVRAKKLQRAREDLGRLVRGLGSRHYPDEAAVRARITVIGQHRRVAAYLCTHISTDPDTGKPTLSWSFDQAAIDAEAAADGW